MSTPELATSAARGMCSPLHRTTHITSAIPVHTRNVKRPEKPDQSSTQTGRSIPDVALIPCSACPPKMSVTSRTVALKIPDPIMPISAATATPVSQYMDTNISIHPYEPVIVSRQHTRHTAVGYLQTGRSSAAESSHTAATAGEGGTSPVWPA